MRAVSIPARTRLPGPLGSRRLLGLANDDRLVEQIRRGSEVAFEVAYERHSPVILGFCRHMLGSLHEAEDAVQQTFAAAFHDLGRHPDRGIMLKPWLFAIARNRCLSMLRARREEPTDRAEQPTAGLSEQVETRAELRQLLADVGELPYEQRAALLLAEVGDLSHAEVAGVLGCGVPRVKALVFRARSGLIQRRAARDTPCEQIQEQLANLRGGSLRRNELRLHLRGCKTCSAYREQVKQQRRMLATALPVVPSLGLKSSVLAAIGMGGSAAGGAGLGAASIAGAFGSSAVAKLAVVGLLAGGGGIVGTTVVDSVRDRAATTSPSAGRDEAAGGGAAGRAERRAEDNPPSQEGAAGGSGARALGSPTPEAVPPGLARRGEKRRRGRVRADGHRPKKRERAPDGGSVAPKPDKRGQTRDNKAGGPRSSNGKARGRVAPPARATPLRRGPPTPKPAKPAAPKAQSSVPVETPPAAGPPPGVGSKVKAKAGR